MSIHTSHQNPLQRLFRRLASAALATVALSALTITASPAHALSVDLTCTGTLDVTYSPGLTLSPHVTTVTADITADCRSKDPTLTSGTAHATGAGSMSCFSGGGSGTFTFHWNNGHASTVRWSDIIAVRPDGQTVGVFTGTVTHGQFQGDTYAGEATMFNLDVLGCLSHEGVTHTTGPMIFTLTSLR